MLKLRPVALSLLALGLAACSTPAATPEVMIEKSPEPRIEQTSAAMVGETPEATHAAMMDETPKGESMMAPAWFNVALTNVATGETFKLSDLHGKVALVETMAVWCSNCLAQQNQVKALHGLLGQRNDFVSLGLAIDPNEDAALVQKYIAQHGFDWTYAVSPGEVSREISQLYGDLFLNPPSTPMLIVDRKGEVHPLPFGIKSAEKSLQAALEPFLKEGM